MLAATPARGHDARMTTQPASLPASVINCAVYDRAGKRRDVSLDAISDVLSVDDGSFVWVGLYEPEEALLDKLQEEFSLHDLAVEDAQHAHQRPKIEAYGPSLFVAVHTAQVIEDRIRFGETHAFLGPRYLVTVRHGASLSYAPVRARVEREPELLALGPAYALYAVLDFIVDNYLPIVSEFRDSLNALEQDVFAETFRRDTIVKLYELKRELTQLRLAVAPMQDILSQLTRIHGALIPDEVRLYFRDVLDHALRVNESTDTLREMLTAAMSVNLSLVTIAQGEVVKRLAGWAALLAAPTLIASWYGMNFVHMPELAGKYSYAVLVGVVVVVCAALFAYLKKVRWL
jgi:magnesium transporter